MASNTTVQQPFRLLDLPAELRCWVYERIEFPTTWHVLGRAQAQFGKRSWPVPPKAHIHDSRVTLIRPHTPLEVLRTCRLVNEEAQEILKRKAEYCKLQPLRYLVDWSAAWALVAPWSNLRSCLGLGEWPWPEQINTLVADFIQLCSHHLSQTRRPQTYDSPRSIRAIEMTITHKSQVAYGVEVLETIMSLVHIQYYGSARLVIIYKSPLPKLQILSEKEPHEPDHMEEDLLRIIPREPVNQASSARGVFVRPLEEEAFDKHVEGLESY